MVVAAVVAVVYALVHLRLVVIPVIVALFFTALLSRPNRFLRARGLPPLPAALLVLLGAVAVVGAAATFIAPSVANEVGQVGDQVRKGIDEVADYLAGGPFDLARDDIDRALDRAQDQLGANAGSVTSGLLSGAVLLTEIVAGLLIALVLTFFFLKDGAYIWGWLTGLFSAPTRGDLREIGTRAWDTLSGYLGGVAIVALVDSVLISLVLIVVGVPLVVPLAVLTFVGAFLPLIGAVVAGLVATLVALVSGGPVDALIVLGGIIVIQQLEGDLLQPIVVGRAVHLHPVTILLSVASGAILAGVVGAFIAVPVVAVSSSAVAYLRDNAAEGPDAAPSEA